MKSSKYLFLDIDGVLNHADYGQDTYHEAYSDLFLVLDVSKVKLLKKLFDSWPDLQAVFISDQRYRPYIDDEMRVNPCKFLAQNFKWLNVAGNAPMKMSSSHWHDVKWWLDENPSDCYVVIDDLSYPSKFPSAGMQNDLSMHCITPKWNVGLTEDDIKAASYILWQQNAHNEAASLVQSILGMDSKNKYLINKKYECSFSFSSSSFSEWHVLENTKSTKVTEMMLIVYDLEKDKTLQGMIQIQCDDTLSYACQQTSTLYLKELGEEGWSTMLQIQSIESLH